jgi:hypothetical protein
MKQKMGWMFGVAVVLAVFAACGGGEGDAIDAAAEGVTAAGEKAAGTVEDMGSEAADALMGTIDEIKSAIAEKETELKAIKDKLAAMSPADLAGSEAGSLKEKSEGLMNEIKGLKEKLEAAMNG